MKTAFTFKRWYWASPGSEQAPKWWDNFRRGRRIEDALKELSSVATVREKTNGNIRVVFKCPNELAFFIIRWS